MNPRQIVQAQIAHHRADAVDPKLTHTRHLQRGISSTGFLASPLRGRSASGKHGVAHLTGFEPASPRSQAQGFCLLADLVEPLVQRPSGECPGSHPRVAVAFSSPSAIRCFQLSYKRTVESRQTR